MDAVETPLPANIVLPRLLASKHFHDVKTGVEETKSVNFTVQSANVSNYVGFTATAARLSSAGEKNAIAEKDPNLILQSKRIGFELGMHEGLASNCQVEDCGSPLKARDSSNSFSSSSKRAGGLQHQRAEKMSKSGTCRFKRPRKDQYEVLTSVAGANNCDVMPVNGEPKPISAVKSRVVKQKLIHNGRRGKKRLSQAAVKSKCNSFLSKSCFMTSTSTSSVNNFHGLCGLKSDIHDVTKHVDQLSLNEILDGSYKLPIPCPPKGKRASNSNENILCSIRKACSILPRHDALDPPQSVAESSGNKGMHSCLMSTNSHAISQDDPNSNKNVMLEDLSSLPKGSSSDCGAATIPSDSANFQPKDVLKRLTLSPIKNLDALLQDTSGAGIFSQSTSSTLHIRAYGKSILPPFPWSLSVGGTCKSNTDSVKVTNNRSTGHSKWARIVSNIAWHEDAKSRLSILGLVTQSRIIIPSGEQKTTSSPKGEVQSTAIRNTDHGQVGPSRPVISASITHASDRTILRKSGIMNSYNSEFNPPSDYNLNDLKFHRKQETKGSLQCHVNEAVIIKPQGSLLPERELIYSKMEESESFHGCSPPQSRQSQHFFHLPPQVNSQDGSSPRLVAAAKILCDLACDSNIKWKPGQNSSKPKWPKKSSRRTIKSLKLVPSEMTKTVRVPKSTIKSGHLVKNVDNLSPGYKFLSIDRIQANIRGTNERINWPVPIVTKVTNNSKKDLLKATSQQNLDSTRLVSTMLSLAQTENVNFRLQKLRKSSTTGPCGKESSKTKK